MLTIPIFTQGNNQQFNKPQFDFQGDTHFSRYNFTDIKIPYNGFDGWMEVKVAYWMNAIKTFSPYLSIIPVLTSESEFWWQKNAQIAAGFQWYPISTDKFYFRGIRFFALAAWRAYFDKPEGVKPEDTDIQIGVDYYYDNLFEESKLTTTIWSNAGFRKTNFSLEDYNAFLWNGNLKVGIRPQLGNSILLIYAVSDWAYVPKYGERWWENFLRIGGGIRLYPKINVKNNYWEGLVKRFHIYGEVLYNLSWLANKPLTDIEETDFRIGLGFATGGFLREIK